jgi:membrane dipeptidase
LTTSADLHQQAFVCDLHADTLQWLAQGESLAGNPGHVDLPRLRRGGMDLQFFSVWVDTVYTASGGAKERSFARACELLDAFDREMGTNRDAVVAVATAAAARQAAAAGRLAAALGVEGGHAIENDLGKLEEFHRRGVRYMTLTWNNTHAWADAAKEETLQGTRHGGLTAFGERVVRRMNQLGMIVDLSHAAESTFWHVLRVSEAPVMASHSNARALSPHYRNLTDAQIRALAARGGVIGVNFYNSFLDAAYWERRAAAEQACKAELDALEREHPYDYPRRAALELELLHRRMGPVRVPASRIADHIEYLVRMVGPDHVALGSDFDGTNALPDDMPDVSHLPQVTALLQERGFAAADIRKILGENVLRLFETICG